MNRKGTILVVDDTPGKVNKIIRATEGTGYEVIHTSVLEVAKDYLKENEVEGIVLDSQFFLEEGDEEARHGAGSRMLSWLEEEGKEIPVLGFSYLQFVTSYPKFWGQMGMLFNGNMFEKFLFSLPTKKDQG